MLGKRINKFISESGICSRREADKYIENGGVTVNGQRAHLGTVVLPGQVVSVNGELVENKAQSVIIAFNKPPGIVSTTDTSDPDNIIYAVGHSQRVFPVGRLDKDSQGLILLTNEGDIVNKILREGNQHEKEYLVTVDQVITPEFIASMEGGVPILGVNTKKCKLISVTPTSFRITLKQGLNRQIRRMCEYLGYQVTRLERIRVMHITLGSLPQGEFRDLSEKERLILFEQLADSEKTAPTKIKKKPEIKSVSAPSKDRPEKKKNAPKKPASTNFHGKNKSKEKASNPNSKRITRR